MVKRSVININTGGFYGPDFLNEYAFINHIHVGSLGVAAIGGTNWFTSGQPIFNKAVLDANGWPNTSAANGNAFGNHFFVPDSTLWNKYIIAWDGQGEFHLMAGTWAVTSSTGLTAQSNGDYTGTNAKVFVTYTGPAQSISWHVEQTNQSGGGYLRNVRFYRDNTVDEADLLAGKIFRRGFKQPLVDLNPMAIRLMNWTGHNDARQCRWENRAVPSYGTYGGCNTTLSPPYPQSTGNNVMTVGSATGMPVAMQHGEIAMTRIGAGFLRCDGTGNTEGSAITSITKANPGVVLTTAAHPYNNGDKVIFLVNGMTQLSYRTAIITLDGVDPTHKFSIGIDTTGFSTFTDGFVNQYISLNVGARGEYPVIFTDGISPASVNGNNYCITGDYKTFYFDKTLYGVKDGSGTPVYGVWILGPQASVSWDPPICGVPIEICTALVVELNAMGPKNTIGMWMTIPHWALLSMDPDYVQASNPAIGAVGVALNGANGYPGLPNGCPLFVEYSNETWNSANSTFVQAGYLGRRGSLRDVTTVASDFAFMVSVRSVVMVKDIKSVYTDSRLKFVLGLWGSLDIPNGNMNYRRVNGSANFLADAAISPSAGTPASYHDYICYAAYIENDNSNSANSLATCTAAWLAAGSDVAAKEAAYALYVQGIYSSGTEVIDRYYGTNSFVNPLISNYAAAAVAQGKQVIMYEGGWNKSITGSADNIAFLTACKASRSFANALRAAHNRFDVVAGAGFPADYIEVDQRWGHTYPDTYGAGNSLYAAGVEGSGLDLSWEYMSLRNRGKRRMVLKT